MSMDYYIYLKRAEDFCAQGFEQYCSWLGLRVKLHPAFSWLEDTGFTPMRLMDERFAKDGGNRDFLSGFELFASEYRHVSQPQKKPTGFLGKLFKAKPAEETPFDRAVKDSAWLIELRCGSADSFEVLLAYVFGAYLVKCCAGVFDDPQTGQFYDDHNQLENEIATIIEELTAQAQTDVLLTHEFKEWT